MFDIKVALFQKLLFLSISGFSMGNGNGKFCWGGFTKLLMGCAPSHIAPINLAVNEGIKKCRLGGVAVVICDWESQDC